MDGRRLQLAAEGGCEGVVRSSALKVAIRSEKKPSHFLRQMASSRTRQLPW
jgi:hypothetical protein